MKLHVEMLGTEEAVKKIKAGIEGFINVMNDVHRASAEYVMDRAHELVPVDTGALASSIGTTEGEYAGGNYFVARTESRAPHARYAEFGTLTTRGPRRKRRGRLAKGATPEYQTLKPPPLSAIGPWAARHGINPYALRWAMMGHRGGGKLQGVRGGRPHPYHYKAFFEDQTFVEHRAAMAEAVVKFLEHYNAT
jgi:hypothetical protein